MTFGEIVREAESSDGDALEAEDVIVGGGEHAADLVVAAFVEREESFFFSDRFEFGGEERF